MKTMVCIKPWVRVAGGGLVWTLGLGLLLCAAAQAQRTATAVAQVVNGFVVGVTVTDGGSGYPVGPLVAISGGGGNGASARATVSGGTVVAITVETTGSGYTSTPLVVIAPPPLSEAPVLESVRLRLMSTLTIQGLVNSTNWILYADELAPKNWRVLTNMVVASSPYVFVDASAPWVQRFYQVKSGPGPKPQRTATAVAQVVNGFVVGVTVTDGGSGYPVGPLVAISGGGGNGASARATMSGGAVVAITVETTGSGYTSTPLVVIAPPPLSEAPVLESVRLRLMSTLTIQGLVNSTNWILYADELAPKNWRVLTNVVVPSSPYVFVDASAPWVQRFYQVKSGPGPKPQLDTNRWAWIDAGTFTMGSPSTEADRSANEDPQTVVTLTRGFWMSKYETTQEEFLAVMGNNPSHFLGDLNRPAEEVSWSAATNYCDKLTVRERAAGRLTAGYAYRLPTEAEWEYACRAGTTTRFGYGDDPWYRQLGDYAWYYENSGSTTHPVGMKSPNAWGLYDMHGNVAEWCLDWYGTYAGGSVPDPQGPNTGSGRVSRGGGYGHVGGVCRSAFRAHNSPESGFVFGGFRPVVASGRP